MKCLKMLLPFKLEVVQKVYQMLKEAYVDKKSSHHASIFFSKTRKS